MTATTTDKPHDAERLALAASGVGLSELETFIAVAELRSFSLAARRMNLSQPAVTARVQKLESLLGVKLLLRTTRSVEPTDAGRRLAERAQAALRDLQSLIHEFASAAGGARSRVVVASTPMLSATLLPRAVLRYSERYPDVDVTVLDLRHSMALQSLEHGECEMAVLALDEPQPKLRFTPLFKEEVVLVVPADHPLAALPSIELGELPPYPVMLLEKYSAVQQSLARAYEALGQQFRPAATAVNLTTLLGMLDAGRGVTLLPRGMAQHNAPRPRVVVPVAGQDLHRLYGVFVPRTAELGAAARSFHDFLRAELSEPVPRLAPRSAD